MPDDEHIGAVSPAEWIALTIILALIGGEMAYLLVVYLWLR